MAFELKVPSVGESINEVQIGQWLKKEGEYVRQDEPVVEVESEKATMEVIAPVSGIISSVRKQSGETASIGEIIGSMEEADAPKGEEKGSAAAAQSARGVEAQGHATRALDADSDEADAKKSAEGKDAGRKDKASSTGETRVMPAAQRALADKGLEAGDVEATGPGGRLLKEDVMRHEGRSATQPAEPEDLESASLPGYREEEVAPMSPMRRTIAKHLVAAQQNAALLTTFNEVDMSGIMKLRKQIQDEFVKKYGIKLGFMSFFIKASIEALKLVPEINAEIRDNSIVYRNYYDIGFAVGTEKGLVVPVLRNTEAMGYAEIELAISDYAQKARQNKISMEDLKGGTFTLSNGGVYGSLLSTPIVNAPQSGILGMHAIQDRPVAVDGEVVIRPMMYIALTYDHRIVDGKGAVTFLKRIKECVENPVRILLEV